MNYEIKVTGSGTQEEIVKALRDVANNILGAGAGNPEGVKDELDDVKWEDATLMTIVSLEEEDSPYMLSDFNEINTPDGLVILDEKIADEEMHDYRIVYRPDLIEDLMRWIGENSKDKEMMKQDLDFLMDWEDDYIFSSISTNAYISSNCSEFNETCEELIAINEKL